MTEEQFPIRVTSSPAMREEDEDEHEDEDELEDELEDEVHPPLLALWLPSCPPLLALWLPSFSWRTRWSTRRR